MAQFEAKVRNQGVSKVVTIPQPVSDDFRAGDRVSVTIEKVNRK